MGPLPGQDRPGRRVETGKSRQKRIVIVHRHLSGKRENVRAEYAQVMDAEQDIERGAAGQRLDIGPRERRLRRNETAGDALLRRPARHAAVAGDHSSHGMALREKDFGTAAGDRGVTDDDRRMETGHRRDSCHGQRNQFWRQNQEWIFFPSSNIFTNCWIFFARVSAFLTVWMRNRMA